MKIRLGDREVSNALDLNSEELIRLLRFQKPKTSKAEFQIVSPVLLILGDKKIQANIVNVRDNESLRNDPYAGDGGGSFTGYYAEEVEKLYPGSITPRKAKDSTESISPFILELELTPEIFDGLYGVKEVIILLRVQNIPAYIKTNKIKVDFNLEDSKKENYTPTIAIKVEKVRPILDLLKAQISESNFFEVFIEGKSEEFYDKGGKDLDDLVELIGIKRKAEESDIELRRRVIDYLKLRMEQLSKVKDSDLQQIVKEETDKKRIERKLNEADEKRKKKKTKEDGD